MSATNITPTIGRKLWYFPSSYDTIEQGPDLQPLDATVCYVWPDGTVNLAVHDWHGYPWTRSRVNLVQEGAEPPSNAGYATWMPFQVAQAAKAAPSVDSLVVEGAVTARELAEAGVVATAQVETKAYPDGTVATGVAPLPDQSPAEHAAKQPAEAPAPSPTVADKALPTTTTTTKRKR